MLSLGVTICDTMLTTTKFEMRPDSVDDDDEYCIEGNKAIENWSFYDKHLFGNSVIDETTPPKQEGWG